MGCLCHSDIAAWLWVKGPNTKSASWSQSKGLIFCCYGRVEHMYCSWGPGWTVSSMQEVYLHLWMVQGWWHLEAQWVVCLPTIVILHAHPIAINVRHSSASNDWWLMHGSPTYEGHYWTKIKKLTLDWAKAARSRWIQVQSIGFLRIRLHLSRSVQICPHRANDSHSKPQTQHQVSARI